MESTIKRRALLKGTGLLGAGLLLGNKAFGDTCIDDTPVQPEGPFYPTKRQQETQQDTNPDLTQLEGSVAKAAGQVCVVNGKVLDDNCNAIPGALVEIWQACATGRYNHPNDPNTAALDPNFQYWGRVTTNGSGFYSFRTIKPGAYPADRNWMRPSHIHFRVVAPGFPTLITQMYWEGDSELGDDQILNSLTPEQRQLVVVPFKASDIVPDALEGLFNIVLSKSFGPLRTPELD
ncbi:MAG: intradiol ring-cleavage dioxygenase [Oligoflexales bacterium]